jgi:hypothetical protein
MLRNINKDIARFENTLRGVGGRRRLERCAFRAAVDVLPLDGRQPAFRGRTDDLCHRGVFLRTERYALEVGSLVVLRMETQFGLLKITGRVVHQIENVGFGCEFIDVDSRQETALSVLVALGSSAPHAVRQIRRLAS